MVTTCTDSFQDYLVDCDDVLRVNAVFTPATLYTWIITDKFGNEYSGTVTTNAEGEMDIQVADLPEGLLNPYAGTFTLRIQDTECQYLQLKMMRVYDSVEFEVRGGTRPKNTLGCEIDCTFAAAPPAYNSAVYEPFAVSTYSIEWTAELRAMYGNSPQVQVYQKLSNGVFTLVSVEVIWNGTDGILDSLDIDFGGTGNFMVIVRG